jgi:hypothetical protein
LDEPPATFRNLIDDYGNIKKPWNYYFKSYLFYQRGR